MKTDTFNILLQAAQSLGTNNYILQLVKMWGFSKGIYF